MGTSADADCSETAHREQHNRHLWCTENTAMQKSEAGKMVCTRAGAHNETHAESDEAAAPRPAPHGATAGAEG